MLILQTCPYCQAALRWMNTLIVENDKYRELTIDIVDERARPGYASKFSYNYVPTYYIGDEKVHEGAASLEIVRKVLEQAAE